MNPSLEGPLAIMFAPPAEERRQIERLPVDHALGVFERTGLGAVTAGQRCQGKTRCSERKEGTHVRPRAAGAFAAYVRRARCDLDSERSVRHLSEHGQFRLRLGR